MSQLASASELHVRRVRRADFSDIVALLNDAACPIAVDRAGAKRFRNIVGDPGCDFDVAIARERVRGFVHVAYARDLHVGNRGSLMALVGATPEVCDTLLARALQRAVRRRCRDITVIPSAWVAIAGVDSTAGWRTVDGCLRLDLQGSGQVARRGELPAGSQTCRG